VWSSCPNVYLVMQPSYYIPSVSPCFSPCSRISCFACSLEVAEVFVLVAWPRHHREGVVLVAIVLFRLKQRMSEKIVAVLLQVDKDCVMIVGGLWSG
jgi:hypothetical protein